MAERLQPTIQEAHEPTGSHASNFRHNCHLRTALIFLRTTGAQGYILKGHVRRELLDTIRAVHAGQRRIPPEVAAELAEHAAEDDLTSREIAVRRLIAAGNANKSDRRPALHCRGHGQEPRHEYTRQAGG
jgi:hypothetical protein